MIEISLLNSLLLLILISIQSVIGVGILVLGTPLFLIFGNNIIEIISLLLPISILTSLINVIYLKFNHKKLKFFIDSETKKKFSMICIPSVVFGIILLNYFQNLINFKYLVSSIILITLVVKYVYKNAIIYSSKSSKKIILFLIGLIHGLTNSGGSLLSIFILIPTLMQLLHFYYDSLIWRRKDGGELISITLSKAL